MVDISAIKANALAQKDIAKQKIAAAKQVAAQRKALKANPVVDYVDMPAPTGDAESDSIADLTELQSGFRKRAFDEGKRFALTTDSEYWGVICFQTRAQKDTFFAALNVLDLGIGARYFDGVAIAKRMGIALPDADVPYKADVKPDPAWVKFCE